MANEELSQFTELAEGPAIADLFGVVDVSDTTDASSGTTKRNKAQYALGSQVNPQTGTTYTYLTTDFRKLVTHTNGSSIAGTLPQAGASFPAGWFMLVQNRGAGVLTITPTTSTIDGAATLVLNQNEGAIIVSDGTNYFTLRGKATGASGVGDVTGPSSSVDSEIALFSSTTGKVIKRATTSGVLKGTSGVIGQSDANDLSSPVYAADGGGSDAYAITLSPAPSAYQTGAHYRFKANTANTGAATLNVNSLGAKTIKKVAGGITTDLSDNDIRSGQFVDVVYDGTNFQMQSTLGNAASGGSTNPTSDTLPYNNAGSFADSPIARLDAATVRAEVFHAAGTTDVNTNGVISGRGTGLVVGRDLQFGLQNGSGTLDALLSKPNTRHSGLLSVRRDTSGNGATFAYPPDSPAQITANQNDYSLGTNRSKYIRLTSNGVWDVTGLTIPSDGLGNTQVAGQEHVLVNVGANGIILKNQSASSSAANRFLCSTGADITLNANEAADIFYDATTQRWRVFKR